MAGDLTALEYTRHASKALSERIIPKEWVERAIGEPQLRIPDPGDPEIERFFRPIPEHGNRVLKVAVNTNATLWRFDSAFFDRDMRGKL